MEDRFAIAEAETVQAVGIVFSCMAVMLIVVHWLCSQSLTAPVCRLPNLHVIGYVAAALLNDFTAMCAADPLVGAGSAMSAPAATVLGSLRSSAMSKAAPPPCFPAPPSVFRRCSAPRSIARHTPAPLCQCDHDGEPPRLQALPRKPPGCVNLKLAVNRLPQALNNGDQS